MRILAIVVVVLAGCGSEATPYFVPPAAFCEGIADAYCEDEYDCMAQPGTCSDWYGYYNRCVARYACYMEIEVDDHCFWDIEGEEGACDAPVGVPGSCPEECSS